MAETKRCVQCSYENPIGQIYCLKCGSFLRNKSYTILSRPTIWSIDPKRFDKETDTPTITFGNSNSEDDRMVIVCPQCKHVENITDDTLPMTCCNCGYFFQAGLDMIVKYRDILKDDEKSDTKESLGIGEEPHIKNDAHSTCEKSGTQLKKIPRDYNTTSLRLNVRSESSIKPVKINPEGDIIGKNGTVLTQLDIDSQIKINRAPTGWYIKVLEGECVLEGSYLNKRVQRPLSNGDNIFIGNKYHIFVEITE